MSTLGRRPRHGPRARQQGIALVLFALGAVAIIGMSGLALDLGSAYLARTRLQNALDAAALSGARTLNQSFSVGAATAEALSTFNANIAQDLIDSGVVPVVETSGTLQPFTPGSANPRYLRATVSALPVTVWLARVLPGVGDTLAVGGTAVAGPAPLGGPICGAIPVILCSPNSDTDCGDGSCYGLTVGAEQEIELKGNHSQVGPGNEGAFVLTCNGGNCFREDMAGLHTACVTPGQTVTTQPGNMTGPTEQGLNTRFGIYDGPTSPAQFPPDVVTDYSPLMFFNAYSARLANPASWDHADGIPQRRVVVVPMANCAAPIHGRGDAPIVGLACFFLTRPAGPQGRVMGQLIASCEGTGNIPEDPGGSGVFKIILYKDPGSTQT